MSLWFDGLSALSDHAWTIFIIFALIFWGMFVVRALLRRTLEKTLTEVELLSLSFTGWITPLLFLSIVAFGISLLLNGTVAGIFLVLVIFSSGFLLLRDKIDFFVLSIFLLILGLSIVLRFAFLRDMFLPSYFDSAEHYRLIHLIVDAYRIGGISKELSDVFYHLGFHSVSAFFSFFLHINIIDFMLVFGQIVLALLGFSLFFVVKRETGSNLSSAFACLLSSFGFHMPAHLMNWGKYPALLGLTAMLFVFGLAYITYRKDEFQVRRTFFVLLAGASLVSVFIHLRTFIVFVVMIIAVLVTVWWERLSLLYRFVGFCVPIAGLGILLYSVQNTMVLRPFLDSYFRDDFWMLLLVFGITIPSIFYYTKQSFFLIVWLTLSVLCMFIPVPLPGLGVQPLLDRPFVQMFVVIPLSLLAGLGFSSLVELLRALNVNLKIFQPLIAFALIGSVVGNAALHYKFYPSTCCRFVTLDDLATFSWIDQSVSANKKILIASSNLYVNSFDKRQVPVGVDAGIWIASLISRNVDFADRGIQFDIKVTHTRLCVRGIDYIYVGGMPESFNFLQIESRPDWYSPSFVLPSAKIYQVIGCDQ